MQNDTLVAVDLAKSVFQVAISHRPGRVSKNRRLSRIQFAEFLAQLPKATIVMEACGSTHFWARRMRALLHTPVLLSPHTVMPYVGRSRTDRNDTKGMLEAHRNEEIRPVPVKTLAQQAPCSLHGIPRPALAEICTESRELERRIKMIETQVAALAAQTPAVARLMTIPGIGLIIATALVAFVGDVHRFPSARHFASYLGLAPKEHSTGSRRRLGAISKQGDVFLRTLLIHGALSVLNAAKRHKTPDRLH